jgi:hypothetical protein
MNELWASYGVVVGLGVCDGGGAEGGVHGSMV